LTSFYTRGSCRIGCLKPLAALSSSVVAVVVLDVEEVVV
jgi:hypothetical protein